MGGPPLGFPRGPEDLVVDDAGNPIRIDKAFGGATRLPRPMQHRHHQRA